MKTKLQEISPIAAWIICASLVIALLVVSSSKSKQPSSIIPTATTATAEGYLEAAKVLTGEETKWKTVEVEEFDPNKTDTEYSTDDGLIKRTTTSLYFDDRVKPVAKKK